MKISFVSHSIYIIQKVKEYNGVKDSLSKYLKSPYLYLWIKKNIGNQCILQRHYRK